MLLYRVLFLQALYLHGVLGGILDAAALLANVEDPEWFQENVPLVDLPNKEIQDVYYYRWMTHREHLSYTAPEHGFVATEFLTFVPWSGPYNSINCAAGHHITEGRWLRDKSYGQDIVDFVRVPNRTDGSMLTSHSGSQAQARGPNPTTTTTKTCIRSTGRTSIVSGLEVRCGNSIS